MKPRGSKAQLELVKTSKHIVQFNWGLLRHDWEDPRVAEFAENIDRVDAIAHRFPGFGWQLPSDEMEIQQTGHQSPIDWCDNERVASTLSVWQSFEALKSFVYTGVHGQFYRKGNTWLEGKEGWPRLVLWTIDAGGRPTVAEGVARLKHLKAHGASSHAFDFKTASDYVGQER